VRYSGGRRFPWPTLHDLDKVLPPVFLSFRGQSGRVVEGCGGTGEYPQNVWVTAKKKTIHLMSVVHGARGR